MWFSANRRLKLKRIDASLRLSRFTISATPPGPSIDAASTRLAGTICVCKSHKNVNQKKKSTHKRHIDSGTVRDRERDRESVYVSARAIDGPSTR